ncbi:hypothetical protein [Desulfobacter vibrioformis]|uniref:hypothetical protein n=1 Tax=Desulfobacter vibrioformis TaxID=34031 RepID=UPI000555406B|nr:hypothetical protein [Desulfobacter vibrioformis]
MKKEVDEQLAAIIMWSNDPYLAKELIREIGILNRMGMDTMVFLIKDGTDLAFPDGIKNICHDPQLQEDLLTGIESCLDSGTFFLACKDCYKKRTAGDKNDLGKPFLGIGVDAFNNFITEAMQADIFLTLQGFTEKRIIELIDQRIAKALAK